SAEPVSPRAVGPPTTPGRARSRARCPVRTHLTFPRLRPGPKRTIPTACPSGFRYLRLGSIATTLQLAECLLWLRASSGLVDACQVDRSFPLPGTRTGAHRLLRPCRTAETPG